MIRWQRAEGAIVFLASVALFMALNGGVAWWAAILLFFAPDLSFAAYALGPRAGAMVYNMVHIYGLGAVLIAAGVLLAIPLLAALGALWLGHAGFDRMMGYGLKSAEGFNLTHLGRIGREPGPR
ncbi:DUF4260 domain-containing protein [Pseudoroseicyclus tamaricis]|uniref:DUF4260 domain-containing protein n=1 Tax=Pseudoroseicyclus tamaricis TaxID=2705421 RepID=A0A6B2JF00_9RHOB|nr:DUF4260 domain-containing protein [Pseudoroseicyclus tamaricis]NDU99530.1 DUF4260 domain-containing protein [Pseudoroseicyclus tamaricis]